MAEVSSGLDVSLGSLYPVAMAKTAAAKKPAKARKEAAGKTQKQRGDIATRFGSRNNPSTGRKKGALNKTTQVQLQAARDAFAPMAKKALDKGNAHLEDCELDGCQACQFWGKLALEYHYGKPTQPIEIDAVALRTEMESIAATAGKSVEEIEKEAYDLGVRVMANYRGTG